MSAGRVPKGARLVLATRNAHKVRELRQILAEVMGEHAADVDLDHAVIGAAEIEGVEDVVESGVTFAENSLLKAHSVCAATGLPSVADDSGLAVEVLGGAPGVFSARWSGSHGNDTANLELLLDQLSDVPDEHRAAKFVCAAALVTPDGHERVEHGELAGWLERAPRGSGGFGYDPIVRVENDTRTVAELPDDEKNAISHRARAVRKLAPALVAVLTAPKGRGVSRN